MFTLKYRKNLYKLVHEEMKKKYRARLKKVMKSNMALEERILMPDEDDFSTAAQLLTTTLTDKVVAMPENLGWLLELYQAGFGSSFS